MSRLGRCRHGEHPDGQRLWRILQCLADCGSCFIPNSTTLGRLETESNCQGYTIYDVCVHQDYPAVEMKYTRCNWAGQECISDKGTNEQNLLLKLNRQHSCPDKEGIVKHILDYCAKQGVTREAWSCADDCSHVLQ